MVVTVKSYSVPKVPAPAGLLVIAGACLGLITDTVPAR